MSINTAYDVINLIKKKVNLYKKNNIDLSLSGFAYFTFAGNTPSKLVIDSKKINFFLLLIEFIGQIKSFISILKIFNYKLLYDEEGHFNKENIIITWSKKNDFDKYGNYYDKYFNISSDNENIFFLLISMDGYLPKLQKKNIAIIVNKKISLFKYFHLFAIFIFKLVKCLFRSGINFFHYFNWYSVFALHTYSLSKEILNNSKIKNFYLPYEGQPFQKYLIKQLVNKNINIYGFAHMILLPIPGNLYYTDGSPNKLLVSGIDQKKILNNFFNWPEKKIELVKSFRFLSNNSKYMNNKIYLPINIFNKRIIIKLIDSYLNSLNNSELNRLEVIIHPNNIYNAFHIKFKNKIKLLLKKHNKKFTNNKEHNKNCSLFIVNTSSIIEALERGLIKAIHISNNPIYDIYDSNLWTSLKVKKLSHNIYSYKMIKKKSMIEFGDDKNYFLKYID